MKLTNNRTLVKKQKIGIYVLLISGLISQNILSQPSVALGVPSASKHAQMLLPSYEKLFQGAGPATNDGSDKTEDKSNKSSSQSSYLSPLTLTDSAEKTIVNESNETNTDNSAVLKSTVSTTDYLPRNGDPQVLQARSIKVERTKKGGKVFKGTLSEQAAAVKVGPVSLLQTDGETQQKVDTVLDAEKVQLADLWESTLTRSPDIQFIIQKLQPTSNQAHLTNILAKMLSTAAFGGLGAMSMMSPSMGTYAAASMGGSMIQSALGMTQSKSDKKAKLTQEEELMMFNMVRTTCDKLVASYRDYKKCSNSLGRAANDLQDLQGMVAEARTGQDASKQLEMEYTLRKQQRDLDSFADDLRRHRQNLIDLAGPDAIAKLDKQLIEEHTLLDQATGQLASETDKTENKFGIVDDTTSVKDKTQTASSTCPPS